MGEPLESKAIQQDFKLIAQGAGIYFQHHKPEAFTDPYHVHTTIEVNYLEGCDMVYSFSGQTVRVPRNRFCLFWAARPHRPIEVIGDGTITNAYVSLQEYLDWPMPQEFTSQLLAGAVMLANEQFEDDASFARRWAAELSTDDPKFSRLHCVELQSRLMRIALSGWTVLAEPTRAPAGLNMGGKSVLHFEKMLRFVAQSYAEPIGLTDVANAAEVSPNYANTLFKKFLGTTVKAHLQEIRIYRARMLLTETDKKILSIALDCGFRTMSSFYEAFHKSTGLAPAQLRNKMRAQDSRRALQTPGPQAAHGPRL